MSIKQYPRNRPKRHFWSDGLSVNESKISVLIICLLASIVFAGINYIKRGDISNNFTTVLTTLIWGIAGINIADKVNKVFNTNNKHLNNDYKQNNKRYEDDIDYKNYI